MVTVAGENPVGEDIRWTVDERYKSLLIYLKKKVWFLNLPPTRSALLFVQLLRRPPAAFPSGLVMLPPPPPEKKTAYAIEHIRDSRSPNLANLQPCPKPNPKPFQYLAVGARRILRLGTAGRNGGTAGMELRWISVAPQRRPHGAEL